MLLLILLFHSWKYQAFSLGPELVYTPLFLGEEFLDELVIGVLQLLVHACHDSDIVVVDQINFLKVEHFWQLAGLVGKEKVADSLRLEGQSSAELHCIQVRWGCAYRSRRRGSSCATHGSRCIAVG